MAFSDERRSLLSSNARISAPFIKVTIGDYTFGVFSRSERQLLKQGDFYKAYDIKYPNYIKSLAVTKINGQVNQYTLTIVYPVTTNDDPNFFEKVFSSVGNTRKIIFTYGDATKPAFIYKDEEAIITKVNTSFGGFQGGQFNGVLTYTVSATSSAALGTASTIQRPSDGAYHKPSDLIKAMFRDPSTGLRDVFTGMNVGNLDKLIAGDDQAVKLDSKLNISALDYLSYLVSCMIPNGSINAQLANDIYILTIHDDTIYDDLLQEGNRQLSGPYFQVTKTSYRTKHADAYQIDIGSPNSKDLILSFSVDDNENYSLYYDYQGKLNDQKYKKVVNRFGQIVDMYAPSATSKNKNFETNAQDRSWWTKITKFPISASITLRGLLRPAQLMTYVRINMIFPGTGKKHISSGLYIVTKQLDKIDEQGYTTTLNMTKIAGDTEGETVRY